MGGHRRNGGGQNANYPCRSNFARSHQLYGGAKRAAASGHAEHRRRDGTLTPEQKTAIANAVKQSNRKVVVPPGVTTRVNSELPAALELYVLPDVTLAQIPAAKLYKYTMVDNRVVLVDPTKMRVVDILSD
jgi:hypothetical protein